MTDTSVTQPPLPDELVKLAATIRNHARQAWLDIGRDLRIAKDKCWHGQWMNFLKACDVNQSTANKMMRYAKLFDSGKFGIFTNLAPTKFLKAVDSQRDKKHHDPPTPDPEPAPVPVSPTIPVSGPKPQSASGQPPSSATSLPPTPTTATPPPATTPAPTVTAAPPTPTPAPAPTTDYSATFAEKNPQFSNTEIALRQRISELEDENDDLQERISFLSSTDPEKERSLNNLKEQIRVANLQIAEWQRKYDDERRTVFALKKQLEKQ